MQSINDEQVYDGDLLTAQQLKEITATKEELFETAVTDLTKNAMSSMVRNARNQGALGYQLQLLKQDDMTVPDTVIKNFQDLGYVVETEESNFKGQDIVNVFIEWDKA